MLSNGGNDNTDSDEDDWDDDGDGFNDDIVNHISTALGQFPHLSDT